MREIYQTEGFILGSRSYGEANCLFAIFTRELGLISVSAQGVRNLRSKLRYALQDFFFAWISFVHGREQWRVTGASPRRSFRFGGDRQSLDLYVRILKLLRRFLPEEERHPELFDLLVQGFHFMELEGLGVRDAESLECFLVASVLSSLGYLAPPLNHRGKLSRALLEGIAGRKREIISHINMALRSSEL